MAQAAEQLYARRGRCVKSSRAALSRLAGSPAGLLLADGVEQKIVAGHRGVGDIEAVQRVAPFSPLFRSTTPPYTCVGSPHIHELLSLDPLPS